MSLRSAFANFIAYKTCYDNDYKRLHIPHPTNVKSAHHTTKREVK